MRAFVRGVAVAGSVLLAAALAPLPAMAQNPAPAHVSVDAGRTLSRVPGIGLGVNDAVWDGNLLDAGLPSLLHGAGVGMMRYPGGSTSDVYHWQTNSTEPGQSYANPNNTFDAFMGVVRQVGAQPLITANYGSGSPQEAAAWVRYANVVKGYGVHYWEVGNEIYGNGSYGANWEYDLHTARGPKAYANNAVQFIQAMKAVDPTIKVGVVLTAPGNWPDGVIGPGDTMDWNHTVLSIVGSLADFAIVHWYPETPGSESDQGLLAMPAKIPGMVATLRAELPQGMKILVTETNSVPYNPGKQSVGLINALFMANTYLGWLEEGVSSVDWWDVHNGITTGTNDSPSLYGTANYGDYGMLANGSCGAGICEPAAETPSANYYGLQMTGRVLGGQGRLVAASSDQPLVAVHTVARPDGSLAVLLVNEDPTTTYRVTLSYDDYRPAPGAHVLFYGQGSQSITEHVAHGMPATRTQVVPPYSLTTLILHSRR